MLTLAGYDASALFSFKSISMFIFKFIDDLKHELCWKHCRLYFNINILSKMLLICGSL